MAEARLPTSVVVSMSLHGGALVLFALMMHEAPKQAEVSVGDVALMIQAQKPKAAAVPRRAVKLSTMDLLKLALPTAPRAAAPAQLSVPIMEHKVALVAAPKLEDKANRALPKLDALNLDKHPVDMARLDVKMDRRTAATTLAALPRLEDVGRKRVKDLPKALALEDSRREAVAAVGVPALSIKTTSRGQAMAAMSVLKEAPQERSPENNIGLGTLLPQRPEMREARAATVMAPKLDKPAPAVHRQAPATQAEVPKKKAVEIEGPLADRKVEASAVPPFPDWAKNQGIMEADVAIRFTVDEDGNVMSGMTLVNSSGYGRLDKLTMDTLKDWRFAPKPGAGVQWGVITFRFVLE